VTSMRTLKPWIKHKRMVFLIVTVFLHSGVSTRA
jgi:hypothetical protein